MQNARYVTLKPLFSIILEYDLCMATKKSIIERSRLLGLGATSPGGACLLKKRNCEPTARNEWTRYLALIISRTKLVANTTQRCVLWKTWSIWWQLFNFSDVDRKVKNFGGAGSKGWAESAPLGWNRTNWSVKYRGDRWPPPVPPFPPVPASLKKNALKN